MTKKLLLTFFVCYLFFGFSAKASHIMGGDFQYQCLGNNKYYILLTLYRDCAGISLTGNQPVTAQSTICNQTINFNLLPINNCAEVTPVTPGCPYLSTCQGGTLPGVDGCTFGDTITLPPCSDWIISWSSCCRNNSITNLTGASGSQSFFLYCTIDNSNGLCANSPILTTLPTPYICPNKPVYYSQGGYDPDGDSINFALAPPLATAINDSIPYITGLSSHYPFNCVPNSVGGPTGFCFNPITGELIFEPNLSQVTVLAIVVNKFRKIGGVWTQIGSIERELQISVENVNCPAVTTTLPALHTPTNITGGTMSINLSYCDTIYQFGVCAGQKLQFTMPCVDGDTVGFRVKTNADIALPGSTVSYLRTSTGGWNATLTWTPAGTATGTHLITVLLEDSVCPFRTTRTYGLAIYINPATVSSPDTVLCPGQTTIITAVGGSSFTWTSSSSATPTVGTSITVSPTVTTSYYVQSNLTTSCKNKDTTVITVTNNTFLASVTPALSTRCMFQNTTLTAGASIASTFKYWWTAVPSGSITTSPNAQAITASAIVNTTYTVRVQDAQGCTQVATAQINVVGVSPDIKLSAVPSVICLGDTSQLSSFASVPDKAYCAPSTSDGCSFGSNNVDSVIIGGVVLGLHLGCSGTALLPGYTDNGYVNSTCFNTGNTYTFTLGTNPSGWDQADYYVWIDYNHNGSFADAGEWVLAINNPGNGNGPYVHSASVTIPATAIPGKTHMRVLAIPWFFGPESNLPCDNSQFEGDYVDYDINICTTNLVYTWTPATGLSSSTVANPKASPATTTLYTLTAVSGGTCSNTDTISVKVVPNYTAVISPLVDSVCNTGSETITITTNPIGNYTYIWYAGDTSSASVNNTSSYTITPPTSTKYYVKIISNSGAGCTKLDSSYMKLLVMPPISSTVTNKLLCYPNDTTTLSAKYASPSNSYCQAFAIDGCNFGSGFISGGIDTFFFGGVINYTTANPCPAAWKNGYKYIGPQTATCLNVGSAYSITFGAGANYFGGPPTNGSNSYLVFIDYNHNGLFDTSELVYTALTSPATGSITIPPSAIPGITRLRLISVPQGFFFTPPALNSLGCNTTADFEGEVLDWDIKICNNSFSYTWTPTTGLASPNAATTSAMVTTTTTYTVSLNGYNGFCHDTSQVTVTAAVFTISAGTDQTICPGTSTTLNASCSPPASNYTWTALSGNNNEITSGGGTLTPSITLPKPDTFIIVAQTILSPTLTCSATDSVIVNFFALIKPNPDPVDITICYNTSATLNGGSSDVTWSWAPANNLNSTSGQVVTTSNLTATTVYTLTATDGNGCVYDTTLKVNVDPPVVASAGNDTIIAYGSTAVLHGYGGVSYVWAPNFAMKNHTSRTPTVNPLQTTTYTVTVTNANSCTGTSTVVVDVTTKCIGLFVPNAFTPNNDGHNDYLELMGVGLFDQLTEFRIYNRWGQLVFQTTDKNLKWDGTFNGQPEPMGSYIYYMQYVCDGQVTQKQGNISLLR